MIAALLFSLGCSSTSRTVAPAGPQGPSEGSHQIKPEAESDWRTRQLDSAKQSFGAKCSRESDQAVLCHYNNSEILLEPGTKRVVFALPIHAERDVGDAIAALEEALPPDTRTELDTSNDVMPLAIFAIPVTSESEDAFFVAAKSAYDRAFSQVSERAGHYLAL